MRQVLAVTLKQLDPRQLAGPDGPLTIGSFTPRSSKGTWVPVSRLSRTIHPKALASVGLLPFVIAVVLNPPNSHHSDTYKHHNCSLKPILGLNQPYPHNDTFILAQPSQLTVQHGYPRDSNCKFRPFFGVCSPVCYMSDEWVMCCRVALSSFFFFFFSSRLALDCYFFPLESRCDVPLSFNCQTG